VSFMCFRVFYIFYCLRFNCELNAVSCFDPARAVLVLVRPWVLYRRLSQRGGGRTLDAVY